VSVIETNPLPRTVESTERTSLFVGHPKAPAKYSSHSAAIITPSAAATQSGVAPRPCKKKKFTLLTDCPFASCLASFPNNYLSLRDHLAQDHFAADLKQAVMKRFRYHVEEQLFSEPCVYCQADEPDMLSHYVLRHGFLDGRLWKFFTERLQRLNLKKCLKADCPYSANNFSDYVRQVQPQDFSCQLVAICNEVPVLCCNVPYQVPQM
jgi:hypothetical protein